MARIHPKRCLNSSGASSSPVQRVRSGLCLALAVALAVISSGPFAGHAAADTCTPGWTLYSTADDSFSWADILGGIGSVIWSGSVKLYINYEAHCYVLGLKAVFGGTLTVAGTPLVSYTIQYPDAFTQYANKGLNAYGDLVSWNPPAGTYPTYIVTTNMGINARGADEFGITGRGVLAVLTDVAASFSLPTALLGKTVKAQIHVGPDKCQCGVKDVVIPAGQTPPKWTVLIHGHEDDWQLFQTTDSTAAYAAGDRLLIVYVTAGDGGAPMSFWQAREEAAMASLRYVVGTASESVVNTTICYTSQSLVCHTMEQWNYGTTISIFMRLPDGNSDGGGFASTGFQSIEKLRDGSISSIAAIDGSAAYGSWQDLYLTIGAIVTNFAMPDATTTVAAPDFDRTRQSYEGKNCNGCSDHPDHLAVGDAVYNATVGQGAPWSRKWYIDYPICWADSRYPVNLTSMEYQQKKAVFMAYSDRLNQLTGVDSYATQPTFWENCFQRQYSRAV